MIIPRMTDCIHGFPEEQCATCLGENATARGAGNGSMAGQSFALVYAPEVREETFVHLNRQGEHWRMRQDPSPSKPAVEVAGSAPSSLTHEPDLSRLARFHEIPYPTSMAAEGVPETDSRFWFDETARANARFAGRIPALLPQG